MRQSVTTGPGRGRRYVIRLSNGVRLGFCEPEDPLAFRLGQSGPSAKEHQKVVRLLFGDGGEGLGERCCPIRATWVDEP